MKIYWFGHSCFKIKEDDYSIVIDPYDSKMLPWLPELDLTANEVISTHDHEDHNNYMAVKVPLNLVYSPFQVTKFKTYHDDKEGKLRGINDIIILKTSNHSICHMGDVGCIPDEDVLNAIKNVEVLMIPVGGCYTIDYSQAQKIIEVVKPKIVIPMHYRIGKKGFPEINTLDDFLKGYSNVINLSTNKLTLDSSLKNGVYVLQYGDMND